MSAYSANKKWRLAHPEKRYTGKKRYYAQFQGGENSGKTWTSEEMDLLTTFEGTDRELSAKIGRSVQAIQGMRSKVKAG